MNKMGIIQKVKDKGYDLEALWITRPTADGADKRILYCKALFQGEVVASVGFIPFSYDEDKIIVSGDFGDEYEPYVKEEHRRKGLMTALYCLAEVSSWKSIEPQENQSSLGQKFWGSSSRPFGED